MKSKPPNKKAKVEGPGGLVATTPGAGQQPTEGKPKPKLLSAIKEGASTSQAAKAAAGMEMTAKMKLNPGNTIGSMPGQVRLSFPTLLNTEIPKISQMTQTFKEDGDKMTQPIPIPIDELDILQWELESVLTSLALRKNSIRIESEILDSLLTGPSSDTSSVSIPSSLLPDHFDPQHQEKLNTVKSIIDSGHGTRTSVSAAAKLVMGAVDQTNVIVSAPTSIVVGSSRKSNNSAAAATSVSVPSPSPSGRQPKKKLKADLGDKSKVGGTKPARAGQNRSHSVSLDESFLQLEAPNQFWEFADSYCRDICQTDMDELEKEIAEFQDLPDSVFSIPPLGKHFSGVEKKNPPESAATAQARNDNTGKDVVGPLTQRLVTALVEDRVSQYSMQPNSNREDLNGTVPDSHLIPRPGLVKALGLDVAGPGSQTPLEARLKTVLTEQGYLLGDEAEDPSNLNPDDEVLAEIKRTFNTLRKLHSHNLDKLEKLRVSAKQELERVSQKKDLEKADKDIIAAYRGITACRMKRKPITQKERSIATKALQYRQHAIEKLESAQVEASGKH